METADRVLLVSLAPIVLDGGSVVAGDHLLIHTGLAVAVVDEMTARDLEDWPGWSTTPTAPRQEGAAP